MSGAAQEPGDAAVAGRRAAGELAAAVLDVLQRAGTALTPGEVRERLGGDLAYTTVVTILSRLHAKGVLDRHKAGRSYLYAPVADQPGLAARRMARVLDAEDDREAVLARFVSGLSERDEEVLRRMLADPRLDGARPADSGPGDSGLGGLRWACPGPGPLLPPGSRQEPLRLRHARSHLPSAGHPGPGGAGRQAAGGSSPAGHRDVAVRREFAGTGAGFEHGARSAGADGPDPRPPR